MDRTLAPVTEIRNSSWSNGKTNENRGTGRSLLSEDGVWGELVLPSPSPTEAAWKSSSSAMASQTGPISPVSAGVDTLMDGSYVPIMVHSASSSCADSWSTSTGCADQDEAENDHYWDHCEQDSDDALAVPKLEPVEDDLDLNELKSAPLTPGLPQENGSSQPKQKRPRGRPRKHPLTPAASASKVAKGRSKTGCITCRKRKKKCDEAKPRCMNCEKNAVVCEGYHEKQIWKSGRERAEEERIRRDSLPIITMQPIFHGVETIEDKVFWKHYINHFSNVLTVEGETKNAFKDIILPLANQHQGLMHSILAVSSKHLDLDAPYGAKIMEENPGATSESLQKRADYHHDEAMRRLCEDMSKSMDKDDPRYHTVLAARYGQMLCLLLQTRADGNPRGEHRFHLQAYQTLIQHSPPEDPIFYTFITEFFQYHIYADDLFWYPDTMTKRLSSEEWKPAAPIYPPRLLGVSDGLFQHLSQITTIRNTIRDNMAAGIDPLVDYTSLYRAAEIDAAIREWTPRWPSGDSRERIGLLYKQVMWVYLFRTIYPPSSSPARRSTLGSLPPMATTTMPGMPQRRASMAATFGATASGHYSGMSGLFSGAQVTHSCPSSRNPSRTSSMHEQDSRSTATNMPDRHRPPSPPPVRRPAQDDRRITLAVDESLAILDSFKPSDPVQTLLLIPCMVIGTACFNKPQRDRIRTSIRAVRGYTGLRNCDRVSEVLEEVWALMDQGDWVAVWDWQSVASRMGYDFLCT